MIINEKNNYIFSGNIHALNVTLIMVTENEELRG
jgi:hypothetical protein